MILHKWDTPLNNYSDLPPKCAPPKGHKLFFGAYVTNLYSSAELFQSTLTPVTFIAKINDDFGVLVIKMAVYCTGRLS